MALTERMGTSVIVVDNDLDDVVMSENVRVGVHTINSWIIGILANAQDSRKGRHFLRNISDIIPCSPDIDISDMPRRRNSNCITYFDSQSQ